jgi:hypothetical protein
MISSASTQVRTLPERTERGPAALVATSPPDVANAPEEGSGGRRRPKGRAASLTAAPVTEAPTHTVRRGQSGTIERKPWLRSTTTPRPTLPPAMPLPAPRGTSGVPVSAAQHTSCSSSAAPRGTATALGTIR